MLLVWLATDVSVMTFFQLVWVVPELERRKLSFPESLTQVQDEHLFHLTQTGSSFCFSSQSGIARDAARDPQRVAHERDVNERAVAVCMHSLFPQGWRRPKRYDARDVVERMHRQLLGHFYIQTNGESVLRHAQRAGTTQFHSFPLFSTLSHSCPIFSTLFHSFSFSHYFHFISNFFGLFHSLPLHPTSFHYMHLISTPFNFSQLH